MEVFTSALTQLGMIRVTGVDARSFLHVQLTQDIQNLTANDTQLAGYCSAKGRLYAIFQVFADGDNVYLITQRELIDMLIKRLRMFVLRAKVVLEDVSEQWQIQGVCSSDALSSNQMLKTENGYRLGVLPAVIGGVRHMRELRVLPEVQANDSPKLWDWLDIMAAQPHITLATSEAFVPQMVNLDRINGVNFKKGCYPGQEVVARSHYLGKLKRRMLAAELKLADSTDQSHLKIGADVFSSLDMSQPSGRIVGVAMNPNDSKVVNILYEISLPQTENSAKMSVAGVEAEWGDVGLPYGLL